MVLKENYPTAFHAEMEGHPLGASPRPPSGNITDMQYCLTSTIDMVAITLSPFVS